MLSEWLMAAPPAPQVDAEVVQGLLASMPDLRRLAVCFNEPSGRLAERKVRPWEAFHDS